MAKRTKQHPGKAVQALIDFGLERGWSPEYIKNVAPKIVELVRKNT